MTEIKKDKNDRQTLNKPMVFIILDGWGLAPPSESNAIRLAKTPVMDKLWEKYPHTSLKASGRAAGLPINQSGNSEAGHMNLGAGRIINQDSVIISQSIQNGTFFKNPVFIMALRHVEKHKSNLHLLGMLSDDQCPHASPDHLEALLKLERLFKIPHVYLHLFTDGRDSPRYAAIKLVKKLQKRLMNHEMIATIMGRFYLERTKQWEITEKAYNALVLGEGLKLKSPQEAILQAYNRGETDEFISPSIISRNHKQAEHFNDYDAIIFFNLRSDRARQLTKPFVQNNFNAKNPGAFKRKKILRHIRFVAMTDFGPDLEGVLTAFPSFDVPNTLPMALAGLKQLYVAEAQKYAHMTYFFNGGYDHPVGGEVRICVPSIPVKHFEEQPKMSADLIANAVLKNIKEKRDDFIALNFANADMLGHTGDIKATILGIEFIDQCLGKITQAVLKQKGTVVITADHGNAEEMVNLETKEVDTKHSSYEVPLIIMSKNKRLLHRKRLPRGVLGNVAPTILDLMNIKKPKLMTGKSLI